MPEYELIRSKRKTLSLCVRDGVLEVRAPLRMPKRDIDRFVVSKGKWVADKLAKSREQQRLRESFELNYGDSALLCGVKYPIAAREGSKAGFDGSAFFMPPGFAPEQIMQCMVQLYRRMAGKHCAERVFHFAAIMSVRPGKTRVTGAKSRWGSCSTKGNVNFSWRLIMADEDVIDYVVVHELAHLREMNHSEKFWGIVADIIPDYRERKARLRALQRKLYNENWG